MLASHDMDIGSLCKYKEQCSLMAIQVNRCTENNLCLCQKQSQKTNFLTRTRAKATVQDIFYDLYKTDESHLVRNQKSFRKNIITRYSLRLSYKWQQSVDQDVDKHILEIRISFINLQMLKFYLYCQIHFTNSYARLD